MRTPFVHLHNHSVYSLRDGAARVEELIGEAVRQRYWALALTDHGNMYAAASFFEKALAAGVKPILGCEIYLRASGQPEVSSDDSESVYLYHLPLLVRDDTGYRNLCRMLSLATPLRGTPVHAVAWETLCAHAEGLLALSGCLRGQVPRLLLGERAEEAARVADAYAQVFGKENFFIELQDHGKDEERRYLPRLIDLSRKVGLPLVVTNDSHFARASDFGRQELLIAIAQDRPLRPIAVADRSGRRFELEGNHYTSAYYLRPYQEMSTVFAEFPKALSVTVEIAERCHFHLRDTTAPRPRYPVPAGTTEEAMLVERARAGLAERGRCDERYSRRLGQELEFITGRRLSGYFLMLWDLVRNACARGVPCAGARGMSSSLVAYALGVTEVDPVECGLFFDMHTGIERGAHPAVEVSHEGRQELIDHLFESYGDEHVAHVIEFTTFQPRATIRECAKVLDVENERVDPLVDALPSETSVRGAAEGFRSLSAELREVVGAAMRIEALPHHATMHGSLVLSATPLPDVVPTSRSGDGRRVSHYPYQDLDRLGFMRVEFPGSRPLSVIAALGEPIPSGTNDPATYALLAHKEVAGVWPLDTEQYRSFTLVPESFERLVLLKAIGRIATRNPTLGRQIEAAVIGGNSAPKGFPELSPILGATGGMLLFQEQVDEILQAFTDHSVRRAEILAAAEEDQMGPHPELVERFKKAASKRALARRAGRILDLLISASPHLVSKASVAAASVQTYWLAYLKAHHPARFLAAHLDEYSGQEPETESLLLECQRMGIETFAPDINLSGGRCVVQELSIQLGLNIVPGLGDQATQEILRAREALGQFNTFCDFLFAVDHRIVHRGTHEALVKGGCFDRMGLARDLLLGALEEFIDLKHSRERLSGQSQLFELEKGDALGLEERIRIESERLQSDTRV
ncbi:MAG: DNA polymerase III subunit alpha [Acidobacteria bacterium]|nr:DNA polymerase III subunit alpha [Acidobacteriota bacterium]